MGRTAILVQYSSFFVSIIAKSVSTTRQLSFRLGLVQRDCYNKSVIPIYDANPSKRQATVTHLLIAVNVIVYIYTATLSDARLMDLFANWGIVPADIYQSGSKIKFTFHDSTPFSLVTTQFLHGGFLHLLGNMWFLKLFGDNVEGKMGSFWFLLFYLSAGAFAAVVHVWSDPTSTIPTIGASGAIAAVLGAYMMLFPLALIIVYFPPLFLFPLPAVIYVCLWFAMQIFLLRATPSDMEGGVAWWAHIGGAIYGVFACYAFVASDSGKSKKE